MRFRGSICLKLPKLARTKKLRKALNYCLRGVRSSVVRGLHSRASLAKNASQEMRAKGRSFINAEECGSLMQPDRRWRADVGGRGGSSDQENVISGDPCKTEHPRHLVHGAVRGLVTLCNSLISCCGLGGRATMAGLTQIASQGYERDQNMYAFAGRGR